MKLLKDKDGVPKRREEQLIIYEGTSIRLLADFSSEILRQKKVRRQRSGLQFKANLGK
jgi:hypothetical protein